MNFSWVALILRLKNHGPLILYLTFWPLIFLRTKCILFLQKHIETSGIEGRPRVQNLVKSLTKRPFLICIGLSDMLTAFAIFPILGPKICYLGPTSNQLSSSIIHVLIKESKREWLNLSRYSQIFPACVFKPLFTLSNVIFKGIW